MNPRDIRIFNEEAKARKFKLTLENADYNRLSFVFDDLYLLSKFMEAAMEKAESTLTATITVIEEEVKADDNL
jgi:hypothetical protein